MQLQNSFQNASNIDLINQLLSSKQQNYFDKCAEIIKELDKRDYQPSDSLSSTIKYLKYIILKIEKAQKYLETQTKTWRVDNVNIKNSKMSIHSKHTNNQIHFKVEGEIEIDTLSVASIIYQGDLYHEWMPFCKHGQTISNQGLAQKIVYSQFQFPLLVKKGGFIYGCMVDRLKQNNKVILYFQGMTQRQEAQEALGQEFRSKCQISPFQIRFGILEGQMISTNKYKFKVYSITDVKFSIYFLPGGLLGFFTKKIVARIFQYIIKKISAIKGTQWQKRIKQDKTGFYSYLKQKQQLMKQLLNQTLK